MSHTRITTRTPFLGPAAWKGSDLRTDPTWTYVLSDEEIADIDAAVAHARHLGLSFDQLDADTFPLPVLSAAIQDWVRALKFGRGFVLVKGLPVARMTQEEATLAYGGIGQHIGAPTAQTPAGDLVGQVRATDDDPHDPSVRRYKTTWAQSLHTDGSDVVGLLCLVPARSGGRSMIASAPAVFNGILESRPDLVDLMFEPFYYDLYEQQADGVDPHFAVPICRDDDGHLSTYYIRFVIEKAQRHASVPRHTEAQVQLFDLIDQLAESDELRLDMDFEPGDMQFLKNSVILHGRSAYRDDDDPAKRRHLLRLWLMLHDR